MKSYIEFENVKKTYKMGDTEIKAVDGVDFNIEKGELAVILGASGAGKTTILNMLGGIDVVTSGNIWVDGKNVAGLKEKDLILYRRNDIGFVFQFYNLIQNLTAKENVELAVQICANHLDVDETIKSVGLEARKNNFPTQLSGGEQQRVAIARALAKSPKLLLCDEPTGALDYVTGKMILELLQETCINTGMTVVIITHNSAIAQIANRVIRVRSGKVESNVINDNPMKVKDIEW
ncbi:MAG: ABC transporter ATP-binding protein [Lachnospiraceae bacterium]|nr:ABC transporter ATP-binding protein [Lachnospiraceae bacterium]